MPFDGKDLSPKYLSPVACALMRGRSRIERGWCQGKMASPTGVCAIGALSGAVVYGHEAERAVKILNLAIGEGSSQSWHDVIRWNDAPGRTKEEVLDLYDRAIALAL